MDEIVFGGAQISCEYPREHLQGWQVPKPSPSVGLEERNECRRPHYHFQAFFLPVNSCLEWNEKGKGCRKEKCPGWGGFSAGWHLGCSVQPGTYGIVAVALGASCR